MLQVQKLTLAINKRNTAVTYTTQVLRDNVWTEVVARKNIGKNARSVNVDLSHVVGAVDGVRLVGGNKFCASSKTLTLIGYELAPSAQESLDCPLSLVPLQEQCVNEYAHIFSIVTFREEEEDHSSSLIEEGLKESLLISEK